MSTQITTAFANQYSTVVDLICQQIESYFRDKVTVERLKGEFGYFDFIGKTAMQEKTSRHAKITYSDTPHTRRRVSASYYFNSDLLDKEDEARILIDPKGKYMDVFEAGAKRKIDELILGGARGTAYTGKTGSTAVPLPSGQKVAHGNTGLTITKISSTLKIFNKNDINPDWPRYWAIGPEDVSDLMDEVEYGSSDYNLVRPLMDGKLVPFMGFNFIMSNRLTTTTGVTYTVAWVPQGITLAISSDIERWVRKNFDYHGATEFYIGMDLGASRMQEECVVETATYHA